MIKMVMNVYLTVLDKNFTLLPLGSESHPRREARAVPMLLLFPLQGT